MIPDTINATFVLFFKLGLSNALVTRMFLLSWMINIRGSKHTRDAERRTRKESNKEKHNKLVSVISLDRDTGRNADNLEATGKRSTIKTSSSFGTLKLSLNTVQQKPFN
jgi:hypothetical protein